MLHPITDHGNAGGSVFDEREQGVFFSGWTLCETGNAAYSDSTYIS
jgi:hypothetical protein